MGKTRIGINGFGRIGRQVLKTIWEYHRDALEVVAINDLFDTKTNAHLLQHDTSYGKFAAAVESTDEVIRINNGEWEVHSCPGDPKLIPWKDCGVDIVMSRYFRTGQPDSIWKAAQKVIITAPSKEEDLTVVVGVNEKTMIRPSIISSPTSCTNCLAPAVKSCTKNSASPKAC